jgi:predicted 3-demethylubiquinone-9 3-methyltransferase (glyoxalase superfamily)
MSQKIMTFLMFEGDAEEAMTFYVSLFDDSKVESVTRYGPGEAGTEGTVMQATFTLAGQQYMAIDSAVHHAFGFTPSMSLFVRCDSTEEIERLYATLSEKGEVKMELSSYGFSARFGWVSDRFGVSWQLNQPY